MKCLEPLPVKWWWKHFGTTILDPCLHTTVRSANPCRNICPRLSLAASKVGGFQIRLKLSWKSWRTDMLKCRLGPWCYLENFDWISKLESRNFFTSQVANNQSCLKFQKLVFLWSMQSCKACGDRGWHAKVERWECPTARETTGVRTKIWVSTILLVCCLCVLAAEQLCNDPSWFKDQEEAFDEEKRQCRRQILRRKNAFVWLGLVDSERVAIPMHAFSLAELLCISCWQVGRPDSCCSPYPLTGDQMAEGDTHISCVTTYNTCVWFVAACFECSSYPPAGQCFRYPSKHGRGTTGRGNLSGRKHSKVWGGFTFIIIFCMPSYHAENLTMQVHWNPTHAVLPLLRPTSKNEQASPRLHSIPNFYILRVGLSQTQWTWQ